MSAAYRGATAYEIQRGRESYEIDVRLASRDRSSLDDLDGLRIILPDGTAAPLDAVVDIDVGRGWARIARFDGVRTVTVTGDVDTTVAKSAPINAAMRRELIPELEEKYPELGVRLAGEAEESAQSGASMVMSLFIGLFGVFILLSFQFRSYLEPIVVMTAIPFAFIGVIWGHILVGLPFTMPSLLGFIALSGIVVNDSILLVEFLKERRRAGVATLDAASMATRMRFRAVLLTSATTIAGLLPLLAERSLQAKIIQPIAVSTAFGIAASTVLVLWILPCFYSILDGLRLDREDRRARRRRVRGRRLGRATSVPSTARRCRCARPARCPRPGMSRGASTVRPERGRTTRRPPSSTRRSSLPPPCAMIVRPGTATPVPELVSWKLPSAPNRQYTSVAVSMRLRMRPTRPVDVRRQEPTSRGSRSALPVVVSSGSASRLRNTTPHLLGLARQRIAQRVDPVDRFAVALGAEGEFGGEARHRDFAGYLVAVDAPFDLRFDARVVDRSTELIAVLGQHELRGMALVVAVVRAGEVGAAGGKQGEREQR